MPTTDEGASDSPWRALQWGAMSRTRCRSVPDSNLPPTVQEGCDYNVITLEDLLHSRENM